MKRERERALVIQKMHFKSSKDVSGTLLRGIKPAFVKSCFRSLYKEINICYSNQKFLPLNLEFHKCAVLWQPNKTGIFTQRNPS